MRRAMQSLTGRASDWNRGYHLAVLAVLLLLGAAACGNGETALQEAEEAGQAEPLVGETITVSGEVGQILGPNSFLIGADYLSLGLTEGTPVFYDGETEISEGGLVQVTGTVTEIILADVATELGLTVDDFGPDATEFEEEFGVVAEEVTFVADADDETALEEQEEAESAEALVGETVALTGTVGEVISPQAFRISGDEPFEGTLILSAEESDVAEGGTAEVTGTVVEFVLADIEEEFGLGLDEDLFVDVTDEYAVVADSVTFVPVE